MPIRLIRKADQKAFDFDNADTAEELLRTGQAVPATGLSVLNPEDEKVYHFERPEDAAEAVAAGGHIEGSKGHRAASMGYVEAALRRLGQGASAGWGDELGGKVKSLFTDQPYEAARDQIRQGDEAAEEKLGLAAPVFDTVGAVAPFLIPGLGEVEAGGLLARGAAAGSGRAIARSVGQGMLAGGGYSDADNAKDLAVDTAIGGAVGGAMEAIAPRVAKTVRNTTRKVGEGLRDATDPNVQRALAAGAEPKHLRAPYRDRVVKAGETLDNINLFDDGELVSIVPDAENGVKLEFDTSKFSGGPDRKTMDGRLEQVTDVTGKQIGDLYKMAGGQGSRKDLGVFLDVFRDTSQDLDNITRHATPGTGENLSKTVNAWLERIRDATDDFQELHEIKKSLVKESRLGIVNGEKPPLAQAATEIYGALNDAIKRRVDELAKQTGNATLSKLNDVYHAASTYRTLLDRGIAQEERQPKMFGFMKQSSATAGAMGATVGASIFGAPGAALGATAGQAIDQMVNSTEGRLWRAAQGQKLADAFGKYSRTKEGFQRAITENPQIFVPLLGPEGWKAIQEMPAHVWEQQARALMPLLAQAGVFEHSDYPTELDGRVEGQDRFAASRQIDKMVDSGKLSPDLAGLKRSALSKDGTLPAELMPQTSQEILARVLGQRP